MERNARSKKDFFIVLANSNFKNNNFDYTNIILMGGEWYDFYQDET